MIILLSRDVFQLTFDAWQNLIYSCSWLKCKIGYFFSKVVDGKKIKMSSIFLIGCYLYLRPGLLEQNSKSPNKSQWNKVKNVLKAHTYQKPQSC